MVFTKDELHVMAGAKKVELLRQVEAQVTAMGKILRLHTKPKKEDGSQQMQELLSVLKLAGEQPVIGTLTKVRGDNSLWVGWTLLSPLQYSSRNRGQKNLGISVPLPNLSLPNPSDINNVLLQDSALIGTMAETWRNALAQSGLVAVDISAGLGEALGVKDEDEIRNVKKAAFLAARALSHAVAKIEGKCCRGG